MYVVGKNIRESSMDLDWDMTAFAHGNGGNTSIASKEFVGQVVRLHPVQYPVTVVTN